MSNPISTIGHDIKVAAVDTVHVVVKVVEFLPKAEQVIATAIKDQPEIKTAVLSLVSQAANIVEDVATDSADKGINLTADEKTLADAEAFFGYFKTTFMPLVEQVYGQIKMDVTGTPAAA